MNEYQEILNKSLLDDDSSWIMIPSSKMKRSIAELHSNLIKLNEFCEI